MDGKGEGIKKYTLPLNKSQDLPYSVGEKHHTTRATWLLDLLW